MPAIDPVFPLSSCDLTESDELVWNIGRYLPSIKFAPPTPPLSPRTFRSGGPRYPRRPTLLITPVMCAQAQPEVHDGKQPQNILLPFK